MIVNNLMRIFVGIWLLSDIFKSEQFLFINKCFYRNTEMHFEINKGDLVKYLTENHFNSLYLDRRFTDQSVPWSRSFRIGPKNETVGSIFRMSRPERPELSLGIPWEKEWNFIFNLIKSDLASM